MSVQSSVPQVGIYRFTLVYGSELPGLATQEVISIAAAAAVLDALKKNTADGVTSWCSPDVPEHKAYVFIRQGFMWPQELTNDFHVVAHDESPDLPTWSTTTPRPETIVGCSYVQTERGGAIHIPGLWEPCLYGPESLKHIAALEFIVRAQAKSLHTMQKTMDSQVEYIKDLSEKLSRASSGISMNQTSADSERQTVGE